MILEGPRWFVVQAQPNAEHKAVAHLNRQGFTTYLPRYLKRRRHARRMDVVAAPLFPRYLFVSIGSDGRLSGGAHYDANDLALMLVATIPLAIYFLRPGVAIAKRLFALASLALFIELIIKSGSRGGFIALISVAVYIIIAFRAIPLRVRLGAVAGAALIMTVFGSAAYWQMMQTLRNPQDDYNMTSPVGRKAIWKRGVGYMLTHPLIGTGANTFEQAEGSLSEI